MATDNRQFTSLSVDPSYTVNGASAQKYNENGGTGASVLQSKVFAIIMIVISLGLLVICIVLAIVLAATLKSNTTSPTTGIESTTNTASISTASDETTTTVTVSTTCGIQEIQPDPRLGRIYGGTEAILGSWPWMLFYEEVETCPNDTCPTYLCGATLISPQYVLTAANCIHSEIDSSILIYAGLHDKTTVVTNDNLQYSAVESFFIHPTYDAATYTDDIAILRLLDPFELTQYVQIACLPGAEPQVGDTVIILGWGTDEVVGEPSNVLMQASTQVVGNCTDLWAGNEMVDDTRQICVENIVTGASACLGDGGGPILAKDGDQWVVSGVSSFVNACNTSNGIPNVYTRVAHYLSWINSIIQ